MLPYKKVNIDPRRITDTDSFHAVLAKTLGFPYFYGKNLNAWIDCMTSLDMPSHGMTSFHAPPDGIFFWSWKTSTISRNGVQSFMQI